VNALPLLLLLIGQSGYSGSPLPVIDAALQAAHVQQSDVVMDIGSGDGRVCVLAAKLHGCRAIGLEFDANLAALSRRTVERNRVAHLVEIRHADALRADLSRATVVYLYHQSDFLTLLRPQLESLKPGTRIVCLDYPPPWMDLEPVTTLTVDGHEHRIYVWEVGMESRRNDSVLLACAKSYPGARFYRGERNNYLVAMAQETAEELARDGERAYRWDGHPDWEQRFHEIRATLGLTGCEISARSWPTTSAELTSQIAYQLLYDWERSAGHWQVISESHTMFGEGTARSRTGVWYAVVVVAD
jgi:SAM-dependent methyltransferase